MGMSYIKPEVARQAFLHALSQQETSGAMPDGVVVVRMEAGEEVATRRLTVVR